MQRTFTQSHPSTNPTPRYGLWVCTCTLTHSHTRIPFISTYIRMLIPTRTHSLTHTHTHTHNHTHARTHTHTPQTHIHMQKRARWSTVFLWWRCRIRFSARGEVCVCMHFCMCVRVVCCVLCTWNTLEEIKTFSNTMHDLPSHVIWPREIKPRVSL